MLDKGLQFKIILALIMCINFSYALMIPLLPPLTKSKGLSESSIGIIFACFSVGSIIASWVLGKVRIFSTMYMNNTPTIATIGLALSCLMSVIFGILQQLNGVWFVSTASLVRTITGISSSMVQGPLFVLVLQLFPESIVQKMAFLEMAMSVGALGSPIIGGGLQLLGEYLEIDSFQFTFFVLGFVYLLGTVVSHYGLKQQVEISKKTDEIPIPVSYIQVFAVKQLLYAILAFISQVTSILALRTFLAVELIESYGWPNSSATFIFIISSVVYFGSAYYVSTVTNKGGTFIIAMFSAALSLFFYAPRVFGLPHHSAFLCIGEVFRGFGLGGCNSLIVSILVEILEKHQFKDTSNQIASSLYIAGWAIGDLIGPLIGGVMIDYLTFEYSSAIMAVILLVISLLYVNARQNELKMTRFEMVEVKEIQCE